MQSILKYSFFLILIITWSCSSQKELVKPAETTPPKPMGTYFWAVKPEINIRARNSTSALKLGKLNDGDSVLVLENQKGWYKIHSDNKSFGWIRSDLLGPKKVSVFANAVNFVDSLFETDSTELFFDKKLLHRRIYLAYPALMYTSKSEIKKYTEQLVQEYQIEVYRGNVTARVLKPGSQDEYLTIDVKGKQNPDIKLPILPFGILSDVDNNTPANIKLTITTPDSVSDDDIIKTARDIVSIYPISYSRVELLFVSDQARCRLWYSEDENGEEYKVNECPD